MKQRLTVLFALVCFSLSLLFNINTFIPSITVSATDVILTKEQTRALFGDTISGLRVTGPNSGDTELVEFEFYSYGYVKYQQYKPGDTPNILGRYCVVYRTDAIFKNDITVNNYINQYSVKLGVPVNIANLNLSEFSFGFSSSEDYMLTNISMASTSAYNTYIYPVYSDDVSGDPYYRIPFQNAGNYVNIANMCIECDDTDTNEMLCSNLCMHKSSLDTFGIDSLVIQQCNRVQRPPNLTGNSADFKNYTYFTIVCPAFSDGWYQLGNDESSGGDININISIPDYSSDFENIDNSLDAVLEYLDILIANSQDRFNQLNNIYAGITSTNSKLDQVNSNLNKIDSHIQQIHGADLSSLYYPSNGDNSRYQSAEHQLQSEMNAAMGDHAYLDSVRDFAGQSLPDLQNRNQLDSSFDNLWYYEDSDGFKWQNMLLFSMPVVTLMIGIISYIIFGKKG